MSAPASAPAPSLLADTGWLAGRHLLLMLRRPASIIGAVLFPLLFTVLFFTVFEGVMARAGIDYAQYLLPAVVIQAMLFAAISGSIWAAEDAAGGIVDRLRSLPIARAAPVLSLLVGQLVRAAVSLVVLVAAGYALGFRFQTTPLHVVGFVLVSLGFAAAVCQAYLTLGFALARVEPVQAIGGVVFYPMLLLSSCFSPVEAFPGWLQPFVEHQPVSRVAAALRALSTDGLPVAQPVMIAAAWIVGIVVVFGVLSARVFARRNA